MKHLSLLCSQSEHRLLFRQKGPDQTPDAQAQQPDNPNDPQGKLDAAKKAVEANEDRATLAAEAFENGKYIEAIGHFTVAMQTDPENRDLYHKRGGAYKMRGYELLDANKTEDANVQFTKAIEDFSVAINDKNYNNGRSVGSYLERALCFDALNQKGKAIQDRKTAAEMYPKNIENESDPKKRAAMLTRKGTLSLQLNEWEQCIKDYTAAFELDPKIINGNHLYNRAFAFLKLGQFEKAIVDFSGVLKESPYDLEVLRLRSELYTAVERYEEARVDRELIYQLNPNKETQRAVAIASFEVARYFGVLRDLVKNKDNKMMHMLEAQNIDPNKQEYEFLFVAVRRYEDAVRLCENDPELQQTVVLSLQKEIENMEGILQRELENPSAGDYLYYGLLHKMLGNDPQALQAFEKVQEIVPDLPDGMNELGFAYGKQGNEKGWKKAIEIYTKLIKTLEEEDNKEDREKKYTFVNGNLSSAFLSRSNYYNALGEDQKCFDDLLRIHKREIAIPEDERFKHAHGPYMKTLQYMSQALLFKDIRVSKDDGTELTKEEKDLAAMKAAKKAYELGGKNYVEYIIQYAAAHSRLENPEAWTYIDQAEQLVQKEVAAEKNVTTNKRQLEYIESFRKDLADRGIPKPE